METIVETDENGNEIIKESSSTVESSSTYPSIGETDENGNLVDGPEDESEEIGPGIPTKPTPGESSSADAGGPVAPGGPLESTSSESKPSETKPSAPSESASAGSGEVLTRSSFSTLKQRKWRYPDSRRTGRKHQQSGWTRGDRTRGIKINTGKTAKTVFPVFAYSSKAGTDCVPFHKSLILLSQFRHKSLL